MDKLIIHKGLNDDLLNAVNLLKTQIYGESVSIIDWSKAYIRRHIELVIILEINNQIIGSAILFHNPTIEIFNKKTFLIGEFEISLNYKNYSEVLFREIEKYAIENNGTYLLGPINGSTWSAYRYKMSHNAISFPGEIHHSSYYPELWLNENFQIYNTYNTHIQFEINSNKIDVNKARSVLPSNNIKIEPNHLGFQDSLELIYPVLFNSFKGKEFFSEISLRDFIELNLPLERIINNNYFLLAFDEKNNECIGFLIAYPNHWDQDNNGLVVKTIARKNSLKWAGLGYLLSKRILEIAEDEGFEYLIHAHMSANKSSIKLSSNYGGKLLNTYHLFYKSL